MDVSIKVPDLATTASEITIIRWLVEVGQPVRLGQPLLEVETDKASMEVESVAAGVLKAVHAQPGDQVAIGQVIAVIENAADAAATVTARLPESPQAARPEATSTPSLAKSRAANSLFARNKLNRAKETGRPSHSSETSPDIVLNATQRELARRLQSSKQTIPHYYLNTSANAERMVAIRDAARSASPSRTIYWDAFFVYAAARALQAFDRMCYRFDEDKLVRRDTGAIGVAADIENNLYVIPVENPLTLTIEQVSDQIGSTAERIQQNDPVARRLKETCLTVTNLGAEGIESFMAIINPPESAILAVGRIAPTVQPENGRIIIQQRVALSLSVDHRIANGKYAAGFLNRIVKELEAL